jgi:serine/threonine protein kinase/tetratricopeptide (TPR) repeat protein
MSRLPALSARWGEISALLDEALALPPDERARWLEALGGDSASLKDTLRELLDEGVETNELLATLPRLALAPAPDAAASEPAAGLLVGPYRLISELGRGGMGSVWLAERADGQLKRRVALKLPRLAWGTATAERLARERDILASLAHPYVARLYDAGVDAQGRPYFAMEYVDGQPIDAWCTQRGVGVPARLRLLEQVCEAVAHAHARLVVHRDLKPGNILVTAEGEVRLLDFGIAKLMEGDRTAETALTALSGRALTLDYASPEQIAGAPLGTASDVYSLGVVAFELLAGARPYRLKRGSAAELEEAIASVDAPRASDVAADPARKRALRGDLDAILAKALRKRPEERYGSVAEFAEDLRRRRDGEPVLARPEGRLYRLGKFAVRHRLGVGAGAAVLVALVTASVVSLWQARLAQQQAQRAQAVQAFMTAIFRANTDAQPDPQKARQTTARELLDIGAQRIDRHLQADPEGRAEVLGLFGDMYYDLGLDVQSADFKRRRVEALRQALGPRDRRVAEALIDFGRQLDQLGRDDEQRRVLEEARAILDALGDTRSEQRAQLLDALASANVHAGALPIELSKQAVAIFRQYHPQAEGFPQALNRLGTALWQSDELAAAEAAFVESLALLERNPKASVSMQTTALLTLASVQSIQQKIAASEATYRRVLALTMQRNGAAHVDTLHTQVRFAWLLHRTARRDEAWRLLDAAVATLAQGQYTPHPTRAVKTHQAQALLADGRYDEAEAPVDWIVADYRGVAGGKSPLLVACLRLQAEQRLGQGRLDDAARSLAEAESLMNAALSAEQRRVVANPIALAAARLALRRGQPDAALQALTRVAPRAGGGTLQPDALRAQIVRAEALLQQGRAAEARAAAQGALDTLAASGLRAYYPALEAEALLPLGQALAREGRAEAACAAFGSAVRLRAASLGERGAFMAEARAAAAGCQPAPEVARR